MIEDDLNLIEELVESYDYLGTGSDGAHAQREYERAIRVWKNMRRMIEKHIGVESND